MLADHGLLLMLLIYLGCKWQGLETVWRALFNQTDSVYEIKDDLVHEVTLLRGGR